MIAIAAIGVKNKNFGRVESGEWRVESGEWRVEGGGWRVEGGGWRVITGHFSSPRLL
jgi:hypothetical protein